MHPQPRAQLRRRRHAERHCRDKRRRHRRALALFRGRQKRGALAPSISSTQPSLPKEEEEEAKQARSE